MSRSVALRRDMSRYVDRRVPRARSCVAKSGKAAMILENVVPSRFEPGIRNPMPIASLASILCAVLTEVF